MPWLWNIIFLWDTVSVQWHYLAQWVYYYKRFKYSVTVLMFCLHACTCTMSCECIDWIYCTCTLCISEDIIALNNILPVTTLYASFNYGWTYMYQALVYIGNLSLHLYSALFFAFKVTLSLLNSDLLVHASLTCVCPVLGPLVAMDAYMWLSKQKMI